MSFWEFFVLLLVFIPMLMLWLFTLTDLARRSDISALAKGLWVVAVVILPLIGMLAYFISRPDDPVINPDPAEQAREIIDDGDTSSMIDQLEQMADLHESGVLSDEEFASAKTKLLDTA